jgi:class 3 adenylate cyclase
MDLQNNSYIAENERRLPPGRLRFPSELETAFAADYYSKILPWLRNGLLLLLTLIIYFRLRDYGSANAPSLWIYTIPGTAMLALLLLTLHRRTGAYWQPLVCVFGAAICLFIFHTEAGIFRAGSGGVNVWYLEETFLRCELLALIVIMLMRLWFVWLSLLGWAVVLIGMRVAVDTLGVTFPLVVERNAAIVFPAMAVLMFISYVQERSARGEFLANHLLAEERARAENLLLNILPASVAERLKTKPGTIADSFAQVSVLFADIVNFTPMAARLTAEETVQLLNDVFSCFDRLTDHYGLEKIKTIGDAYMVVGGLPEPRADHAEAIADLALEMQVEIARFAREKGEPLQIRIGIHTGPVVAGVIGTRRFIYDLWGDTVNVASRMEAHGEPGVIQVTTAVYERLQTQYVFGEARTISVKGRGNMEVYRLLGRQDEHQPDLLRSG